MDHTRALQASYLSHFLTLLLFNNSRALLRLSVVSAAGGQETGRAMSLSAQPHYTGVGALRHKSSQKCTATAAQNNLIGKPLPASRGI